MTDNNIQEAEVGSGTKVADTKQSEKRAQLTLKAIQLRLKQEKERAALQQQKKSLSVKEETMTESFSPSQIAALKAEYSKINGIDPDSDTYKKLIAMLDRLDLKTLKSLAGAEIKFVSKLAQNRVLRKSMKKEDVQLDEISTKLLAKAAHAASDPDADYSYGKSHDPQKFADRAKKTKDAKSAAAVQGAADAKGHYARPGHTLGSYDKLAHRSPARVTSAGKANKQDVNKLKGNIKRNEEVESIDELSTNKLADYKKKAGDSASAADKAGDTKTGNKRFSGLMKATRKQFDNDSKKEVTEMDNTDPHSGPEREVKPVTNKKRIVYKRHEKEDVKTEELSPKQKAMDKNKNGKIDGSDLAKLRGEELSAKQKALDKNNNGKIDGSDLAHLRSKKKQPQGADFAAQRRKERMASNGRMDEAKSDYEVYHKDYSTAVQTAIKQAEKRGFEVDMDDWHDKVATGPKKPSSGKTNSFSINLMKDGKPSKKKLQMQVYNMDNHKYELNMYIEEVEIAEAGPGLWANIRAKRERIKNGSNERMKKPGEKGAPEAGALDRAKGKNEAASPAQQAAIAIAMKKDGKKPKDMEEMTDGDKSSVALQAMVARKKLQQTAGKNKSQSFVDKMVSKANAGDRLPKKPADEYDRKVVKYLKKKHGMSETSVAETYEGVVDKIKAIKRGMQAKAKADDHFDKAGDPKNANASKDLKKAVRYSNLLNKEEVVLEARKKSFKDVKKKMKEEEVPNKSTIKKGDMLTGKREPIEINPELKEPAR